jgi:hypothetical protein
MTMSKLRTSLFLCTILFAASCNPNGPQQTTHNDVQRDSTKSVDVGDMLSLLQGKWQNEKDTANSIEISGNSIRHFNGGKMAVEDSLEIDIQCQNVSCLPGKDTLPPGWCFLEKGQYDIQCNRVTKCDGKSLRFRVIGAEQGVISFRKLP